MLDDMSTTVFLSSKRRPSRVLAFTLVEMVVTMALVGILAAIAYPSYVNQIIKGNRSAAQQFMLDLANAQAQYQIDARSYTSVIGGGGLGLSPSNATSTCVRSRRCVTGSRASKPSRCMSRWTTARKN